MKLRPHHLFCTLGYQGYGYSEDFVKNMDFITSTLSPNLQIQLAVGTDDICAHCPKKLGENLCIENESVLSYDSKVLSTFNLVEKTYNYGELLDYIKSQATLEKLNYICSDCSWLETCTYRSKLL